MGGCWHIFEWYKKSYDSCRGGPTIWPHRSIHCWELKKNLLNIISPWMLMDPPPHLVATDQGVDNLPSSDLGLNCVKSYPHMRPVAWSWIFRTVVLENRSWACPQLLPRRLPEGRHWQHDIKPTFSRVSYSNLPSRDAQRLHRHKWVSSLTLMFGATRQAND